MKLSFSIMYVFLSILPFGPQTDIIDTLCAHFQSGNSKEIAHNFASSVDLIIVDEEDVYSKAQAEQIIRGFLSKNQPIKAKVIHRLNTNPKYRYGALSLITKNETFRISITMKKNNASFFITELRIETEK